MTLRDSLHFVLRNVKKNKTRLLMTILATAIGCCFLIVLVSVGIGFKQSIVDRMVGDRLVTEINVPGKMSEGHRDMTSADMEWLKQLPHQKTVTYKNYVRQDVQPRIDEQQLTNASLMQVDFAAEALAGFKLSTGTVPRPDVAEVVLGYHVVENSSTYIGKELQLTISYYEQDEMKQQVIPVTITGVSEKPSREWQEDMSIYIGEHTLNEIEQLTGTQFGELPLIVEGEEKQDDGQLIPSPSDERIYNNVSVIASHMRYVPELSAQLSEQGYYNYSVANELKQINVIFTIITIGLSFIGIIAILIASIGIFNTMTMAVTERYQDIGVMKAIGAHPTIIKRVFLLESALIGLLGAIVGTIVAYVISFAVNWALPVAIEIFMEETMPIGFKFSSIPVTLVLSASILSLLIAMLSGFRPAKRATQIDVLRALRRDV